MADITDILDEIAEIYKNDSGPRVSGSTSTTGSSPPPEHPVMFDAVTGEPMEQRDIFSNNKHVATLDFHKPTGAWFLDIGELTKLANVDNAVDLIRAEEAK